MTRPAPPPRTDLETFRRTVDAGHTVIPVVVELLSDWWTPVSAFHSLVGNEPNVFLLESVEGGERIGRYSFLGRRPFLIARARDGRIRFEGEQADRLGPLPAAPLEALNRVFARFRAPRMEGLPPFLSGAVGYFGYDTVRWVESVPDGGLPAAP